MGFLNLNAPILGIMVNSKMSITTDRIKGKYPMFPAGMFIF
jgi:hypothetical protein